MKHIIHDFSKSGICIEHGLTWFVEKPQVKQEHHDHNRGRDVNKYTVWCKKCMPSQDKQCSSGKDLKTEPENNGFTNSNLF